MKNKESELNFPCDECFPNICQKQHALFTVSKDIHFIFETLQYNLIVFYQREEVISFDIKLIFIFRFVLSVTNGVTCC